MEGKIKIAKNGPYIVSGNIPIDEQTTHFDKQGYADRWVLGKKYPEKNCALCRCGKSEGKPFCDGAHSKEKFDGTETADRTPFKEQAQELKGPLLTLYDAPYLCAGIGFCHHAGGIWKLVKDEDEKSKSIAIKEAHDCPAGRLIVSEKGKILDPKFKKSISIVIQDGMEGPIWVRGGIPIESSDGSLYEVRNSVTLCRCGKSGIKPLCDGSHMH